MKSELLFYPFFDPHHMLTKNEYMYLSVNSCRFNRVHKLYIASYSI